MSKDLMGDMVERRKELLADGMTVVEWFDPSMSEHMDAFRALRENGQWPQGFIPEGLEFPGTWVVLLNEKVLKHLMEGKVPLDSDPEDKKIKQLVERETVQGLVDAIEDLVADAKMDGRFSGEEKFTTLHDIAARVMDDPKLAGLVADPGFATALKAKRLGALLPYLRQNESKITEAPEDNMPPEPDAEEPKPEGEEGEPIVPAEEEPEADVDLEKIYLGQSGDTHFYVVSDKNEAGMTEDLQVTDQEGNVIVSAKEEGLDIGDVSAFILGAIQNEALQGAQLERSVVMQYLVPQVEAELEEPEEELGQEPGAGEEKPAPGEEEEEGAPPEAMPRESKVTESKGAPGMLIEDAKGNSFSVEVVDEGTAGETVVSINGREFRFQEAMVKVFAENGELTDESVKELVLQTLSHLDESDYAELVGQGVHEDMAQPGSPVVPNQLTKEPEEGVTEDDIPGGLAAEREELTVKPEQIEMGVEVEMEHTDDPRKAVEIALDHLAEDPEYYTKLDRMEKGACDTEGEPLSGEEDYEECKMRRPVAREAKKDPKAKVRNRGTVVFPAESSSVTDDKDHFPINDEDQARNALARVNQYSSAPKWYKGSLSAMKKRVASAVRGKYPSIKVTKASTEGKVPLDSDAEEKKIQLLKENTRVDEWLDKELMQRNDVLFKELVPTSGAAETLEGELLRAANRLIYRYYNDGDYFYEGYGTETAGPAHAFLKAHSSHIPGLEKALSELYDARDEAYEAGLTGVAAKVLDYIESREGKYTKNTEDMLDYQSEFEDEEDEDEEYWDEYSEEDDWGDEEEDEFECRKSKMKSQEGKVPLDSDSEDKKIKQLVESKNVAIHADWKDLDGLIGGVINAFKTFGLHAQDDPTSRGGDTIGILVSDAPIPELGSYEELADWVTEQKASEGSEEQPLAEGILELVGEVEWMTPEDADAVRKAVEDGRVDAEWPSDDEMIDALSGLEDYVNPATEPGDVRTAYLRHIIVPKAIATAEVGEGDMKEGEYSDMAGSSFKKVFQVDYITDAGEEKSTRVMAHDEREAGEMLTRQKGVKSVVRAELVKEAAEGDVEEGQDPDEKVDQDIADLAVEPEDEKEEADESTEDELTDDEARALRTAESLLGFQPEPLKMDEAAIGDLVQIVKRANFEMVVEEATIKQMDEERGVEITGNTIPEKQQWFGPKHYMVIKL